MLGDVTKKRRGAPQDMVAPTLASRTASTNRNLDSTVGSRVRL
jgi:hypothetical protein